MSDELRRSWMFVPGHRQKMIDKALGLTQVDALMLDIEDGVPLQEKQTARQQIGASLVKEREPGTPPARFVRVSAVGFEHITADLAHIVQPGLDGLVLPKVETPQQIQLVDAVLRDRERQMGLALGKIALLIAIESPRGLLNAYSTRHFVASRDRIVVRSGRSRQGARFAVSKRSGSVGATVPEVDSGGCHGGCQYSGGRRSVARSVGP